MHSMINELSPKSVNYLVTIKRDENVRSNDWASALSYALDGAPIRLSTINCTSTVYHGRVFVPKKYKIKLEKSLKQLKRKKQISEYDIEGVTEGDDLSVFVVAPEPRVCYSIIKSGFELRSPAVIEESSEAYPIAAYVQTDTDERISKLTRALVAQKVHIHGIFKSPESATFIPPKQFDKKTLDVIRLLVEGNYFNPAARRISQKDISKKLGMSIGKVNETIRVIELVGFNNLVYSSPDLAKFKKSFKTIVDSDKSLD